MTSDSQEKTIHRLLGDHNVGRCIARADGSVIVQAHSPRATYRVTQDGDHVPLNGHRIEEGDFWDYPMPAYLRDDFAIDDEDFARFAKNGVVTVEVIESPEPGKVSFYFADFPAYHAGPDRDEPVTVDYDEFVKSVNKPMEGAYRHVEAVAA